MSDGALHGLKVLDLTRVLAGPLSAMFLGDLGADVLKVERPGRGDDTRAWGPPFAESPLAGTVSQATAARIRRKRGTRRKCFTVPAQK